MNMDCFEEGLIQTYIDGEIAKEEKRLIENHLKNCEACQSRLEEQKARKSSVLTAINLLAESAGKNENTYDIKVRKLPLKRVLYAITAASILLIGFAFFKNFNKTQIYQPDIYYELDWSVDANKPITDQEFMINMYELDEGAEGDLIQ